MSIRAIFPFLSVLGMLLSCSSSSEPNPSSSTREIEENSKRILFFGDSITAGYGLDPSQAFPALIQTKIQEEGWRFDVINAGVSGDTTASGVSRVDWLLKQKVDVMVLELGANDGLRGLPLSVIRENLQSIITKSKEKYPEIKIVLAGMKMPPNYGLKYAFGFQKIFKQIAKENDLPLIPFVLEGVAGVTRLNQADGIHPTAEGQEIVADNVWEVLKDVLKKEAQS